VSEEEDVNGADSFRPVGHIMRDLKKADEAIDSAKRKREDLVRELEQLADATKSYAETARSKNT